MKQFGIKKSLLKGSLAIPSSKSQTLRAILFASLGCGKSVIHNYLPSADTEAMINACRLFGASLEVFPKKLEIFGMGGPPFCTENVIDAGNSGIVLRFCSAIGALMSHPVVVTGDYSIRHYRPMKPLLNGLSQLGVSALSMRGDDHAPVIIHGPIVPGKAILSGEDSQPVSALLIASAFAKGEVELVVQNPGEKPWIEMTLDWFDRLGILYENNEYTHYRLFGNSNYRGFIYRVPGDFSSAAFPIAAALITDSGLTLSNIEMSDSQGDKEVIRILQQMGAIIEIDDVNKLLHVKKGGRLQGMKIDINNTIDALPILAVIGSFAEGETHLYNGAIARKKECNRIQSIVMELQKMGADIAEQEDGVRIRKSSLRGNHVHSYGDHRMAMALSVAGLASEGETIVSPIECLGKTFPSFLKDFQQIGANIEEKQ